MLKQWHHLYIARICVEAETPLSIQTGHADLNYDTSLVRDASGLPALPSTSIRGILRHLHQDQYSVDETNEIFGFAKVTSNDPNDQTSRLQISWGVLHNRNNSPVQPLESLTQEQAFLEELAQLQPIKRERVRLNHLGCAADEGKFDVTACPKGVRFSFEMKYWSDQANDPHWQHLLSLLVHPQFRLGHSTRSGFGALRIHTLHQGHFDLTQADQAQAWRALSRRLNDTQGLTSALPEANHEGCLNINLSLTAEGFVRIGGGDIPMHDSEDSTDLRMQSESFIQWQADQGVFCKRVPIIPASAIKGPIAHRALFHCNRLTQQFADQLAPDQLTQAANRNSHEALIELLGAAKGDLLLKDSQYQDGKAGQLLINDVYLSDQAETLQLWHNRIDRFTGGVIDGALFTEEVLFEPELNVTLTLVNPDGLSELAKQALEATLEDLRQGRLAIGAGAARGLGSFHGDYQPRPLFHTTEGAQ